LDVETDVNTAFRISCGSAPSSTVADDNAEAERRTVQVFAGNLVVPRRPEKERV
jgi:hypothetical protein